MTNNPLDVTWPVSQRVLDVIAEEIHELRAKVAVASARVQHLERVVTNLIAVAAHRPTCHEWGGDGCTCGLRDVIWTIDCEPANQRRLALVASEGTA